MKNLFFFVVLLALTGNVLAQTTDATKYASLITGQSLQKHLNIVASEEMQGRATGTEGQRKAAAYIESQFKQIGLTAPVSLNGYQQFYPLFQDSMTKCDLQFGGYSAKLKTDYLPASTEKVKLQGKKMVFAGYGISDKNYDDYKNIDVKGKVIIIFSGEPVKEGKFIVSGTGSKSEWSSRTFSRKLNTASQKGAIAVLVINPNQETFSQSPTAVSVYRTLPTTLSTTPAAYVFISHEFAKRIMNERFDDLLKKAKDSFPFTTSDSWKKKIKTIYEYEKNTSTINASNVLGVLEGTDKKNEYVFLTGHYDHLGVRDGQIYYGADDDGSGTVGVIAMATAFAKAKAEGKGPRRTIVFMTVSGEERGLWGSEYYTDNPVYPLDKTSVDLNTDMVGRIDTERDLSDTTNYVYVVGHDKISSDLPVINESVNKDCCGLTLDYKFDDPNDPQRIYYRSDHYNFARKGVPVLFFYDGMLKADYHRPSDTVDKINWTLYEKRVRMIFQTAWEMANRDEMLKRDKPLPVGTR